MKTIARVLIVALTLLFVSQVVPGIIVENIYAAIIAAIVLGLLNIFIKPLLVVLTLPITILTLGLFIFVINGLLFVFVASFIDGFSVEGFWGAILGSVIVSIVSSLANKFID